MKNRNQNPKDNWRTPPYIYDPLHEEFNFDFDPCPINPAFDGLSVSWGGSNFVNPPYSLKLKEAFIRKAYSESREGKLVVMLLPVSTSTKIFHEIIFPHAEIRFVKGRIRFIGTNTKGEKVYSKVGQHDSMIVIFKYEYDIKEEEDMKVLKGDEEKKYISQQKARALLIQLKNELSFEWDVEMVETPEMGSHPTKTYRKLKLLHQTWSNPDPEDLTKIFGRIMDVEGVKMCWTNGKKFTDKTFEINIQIA